MKPVKNFWKAQGRLVDLNSGEGLWFELTGNSLQDVSSKAKNYMKGKAGTYKQLNIKASAFHSGGKCVSLNPGNGNNSVLWSPMATSHPDCARFQEVTVQPRQDIGQLRQCVHNHRVDAVGLVKDKKITVPNRKAEVWVQGLDQTEVLVEMWGDSFVNLLPKMEVDTTVLQDMAFAFKWVGVGGARASHALHALRALALTDLCCLPSPCASVYVFVCVSGADYARVCASNDP